MTSRLVWATAQRSLGCSDPAHSRAVPSGSVNSTSMANVHWMSARVCANVDGEQNFGKHSICSRKRPPPAAWDESHALFYATCG